MKGFETAKFTSNSVLQEFRLTWLENAKTTFLLLFFVVIKCADVHEKTWLLLPFYVNVWVKFYYQRFTIYRYKYFRCGRPFCYFRLSVVVAIIWRHFPLTRDGRKPQHYRNTVGILTLSIVVPDFRISGLGGHITISGCQSLSQSFSLNSTWSKPQARHWKRTHLLFYLNSWGLFTPSATRVRKIEAQYDG